MYYFIPAWKRTERFWQAELTPWYRTKHKLEFDDLLHQLRIFKEQEVSSCILLLAYQPQTRYFLHRQDVLEMDYYSVFDAIQGISKDESMHPLALKDINWDASCDFTYTPFLIVVHRHQQLYAHVEHGAEGFISQITYFKDGERDTAYIFDDRGFLSSLLIYEGQVPAYRYYFDVSGTWQIREKLQGEHQWVDVNPACQARFKQSVYPSMSDVVWEFFEDYLQQHYQVKDRFVIASQADWNQQILSHLPSEAEKILSFFVERNQYDCLEDYAPVLEKVSLVIGDHKAQLKRLEQLYPDYAFKMHHLPSFDTRLKLGTSQRLKESKIYYQLDLKEPFDTEGVYRVLKFVSENPLTEVTFAAFNAEAYQIEDFEQQLEQVIAERLQLTSLEKESSIIGAENALVENRQTDYRFRVQNINDETALMIELEETRLIVDIQTTANTYTQIAGISAGIPQINRHESEYVQHRKNGFILKEVAEFDEAAHYFLDTLKHWNESLIHSIDRIRENTGDQFIGKYERWLKEVKNEE